ncbi:MAG: glycosyl transferase, partial [bacterium]|nr:glycosyl transferase [bacterium]
MPPALWGGAAMLAGLSFADDRYGLPTGVRFLAHGVVALWLVAVIDLGGPLWSWPLAVAAVVWMTNLYNFMDGSDGLAGGMAVFGFGTYALAAVMQGQADLALSSTVIAIAAVGFLIFNFPPARVFMGDAGSIPLGFLAAGLGLLGTAHDVWPGW